MSERRSARRGGVAVVATTVGLVIGGVVGVGMTGAASDVATTESAVHSPMQQHAPGGPAGSAERAEQARERVRAVLDGLVADGTLTSEQADAVAEGLDAARAEHRAELETERAERRAARQEMRQQMRSEMQRRFGAQGGTGTS